MFRQVQFHEFVLLAEDLKQLKTKEIMGVQTKGMMVELLVHLSLTRRNLSIADRLTHLNTKRNLRSKHHLRTNRCHLHC